MALIKKNIFITSLPGVGKTTLIREIAGELKDLRPVGFYTSEIREGGVRKGFELTGLVRGRGVLSHINIKSPYRVGRYRVDIKGFEIFLGSIQFFHPETSLIIIDEIGKMECLSDDFRKLLIEILDSRKLVIATIAFKGGGFIEGIKKRGDVRIFEITEGNRDTLLFEILKEAKRLLPASAGYVRT